MDDDEYYFEEKEEEYQRYVDEEFNLEEGVEGDDEEAGEAMQDYNLDEEWGEEPEIEMIAERNAFERVGGNSLLNLNIASGDRKYIKYLSDEEKFKLKVSMYLSYFDIDNKGKETLVKIIDSIQNVKYKNPYCLLIGFVCVSGKKIDKNMVKKKYEKEEEFSITMADKLRYARMVKNVKEKLN